MSAERDILVYLSKHKKSLKYKGIRIGLFGLPDFKYYKQQTLANKCSILQKKGYIRKNKSTGEIFITKEGEYFLETSKDFLYKFATKIDENMPKNLLVIYDIPEEKVRERNWFRYHLKKFHFVMIQRSVWVGPSPLPKEFMAYVKEIKLNDSLKTFKLAKGYEF